MNQRRPLVAANWKMNGALASLRPLLDEILAGLNTEAEVAICPPAVYLAETAAKLAGSDVALGAQTVSEYEAGAYTGEVSAAMLKDYNCRYVIVGHSERRNLYGESDAVVAAKFQAVRVAGLTPILCVGETLAEREADATEAVVGRQLEAVLGGGDFGDAVIAYEPVWAIGTGRTATTEQAEAVHAFIRQHLPIVIQQTTRILYGGSVKADNASSLFAMTNIDGGLIGGASLDAQAFLTICHSTTGHSTTGHATR